LLNLLIGFLSPQVDPEIEDPGLPSKETDEFKPFIRRLPEFKFWYVSKYLCILYSANFSVTQNPNLVCIPIPTSQFPLLFYNVSWRMTTVSGQLLQLRTYLCFIHHVQEIRKL
jgi:hypothetical protein